MILLTAVLASSLLAQLEAPPENQPIIVTLKEGTNKTFHAKCLKVVGDLWELQYNEPDNSATKTFRREEVFDWEKESPQAVQARFDKYYTDRGFVKIASGWISKEDYEFARKAVADAQVLDSQLHEPESREEILKTVGEYSTADDSGSPGYLILWGPQIALIIGGLVLTAILVKLLILGGED